MTDIKSLDQEMGENPLLERLISFGFSAAEAKIYVFLLQNGSAIGGSQIAHATGLHRQYVYVAIPRLVELNLVEEVPHGKQNKYLARPPAEIERIGKRRALVAGDLAHDLNQISNIGNEQDFEVIQGKKAIQLSEMEYVRRSVENGEEYILGGAAAGFSEVMGDVLETYLTEKQKKNIRVKYLGGTREIEDFKKYFHVYKNQEYRFMKQLPEGVSHMVIRKDSVSFFTFLNPPLVYVVKSTVVAEHYKKFFMMLWEMGESAT